MNNQLDKPDANNNFEIILQGPFYVLVEIKIAVWRQMRLFLLLYDFQKHKSMRIALKHYIKLLYLN